MVEFLSIFYDPLNAVDVLDCLKEAIRTNEDAIMDLNKQQLDKGLDATGKDLGKYRNFSYKNRWRPVDLKLTGKFRNEFSLEVTDKGTEIFSQDSKEEKLKTQYGKDIFGIPAPLIDNMQEIVREDFIRNYQNELR
jgi:hypothetical protein